MNDHLDSAHCTSSDEEVAALLALDALEPEEQADAELRIGTLPVEAGKATCGWRRAVSTAPPPDLRAQVLAEALRRRPAGRSTGHPQAITQADACARTAEDFHALLASLASEEWSMVAHETHGSVRRLVGHLLGVERLNARWLDPADDVPHLPDHVASTRSAVESVADLPPADLVRQWHEAARAMLDAALAHPGDDVVRFHDLERTVDGLLTTRTFELWAHGMDIALATGRPLPMLDDQRMVLMSSRLMAAIREALAYRGVAVADRSVRFVLTENAGARYDAPLGASAPASPAAPDATVVAEVVTLCPVAAGRSTSTTWSSSWRGTPTSQGSSWLTSTPSRGTEGGPAQETDRRPGQHQHDEAPGDARHAVGEPFVRDPLGPVLGQWSAGGDVALGGGSEADVSGHPLEAIGAAGGVEADQAGKHQSDQQHAAEHDPERNGSHARALWTGA
jgi:uncharacterized protein (TIGR03083 family)